MSEDAFHRSAAGDERQRAILRVIGWCGLGLIGVAAAMNDFLAQAPANAQGIGPILQAPSAALPFGTDALGRDLLSEVLHALGTTLVRSLIAAAFTISTGALLGFIAARLPKPLATAIRWSIGVPAAVPALLLAVLIVGIAGREQSAIAAGLAAAPLAFVRAFDRAEREEHTAAAAFALATGISPATLLRRDLVYEFRDHFLSTSARALAAVTIILTTASFLGFGATPPHRDLGLMIASAKSTFMTAWWTAAVPGAVLILIVLSARLASGLDEGEAP
jgi:peptide/nickel transport system permease protein